MFNKWIIAVIVCMFIPVVNAGAAGAKPDNAHLPVTVLFSGNQCTQDSPSIRQLSRKVQVDAFLEQNTHILSRTPKEPLTPIDFSNDVIVAIWMGKKPTAGYGLSLEKESAEVKEDTVVVQANFKVPDANAMVAQVITRPCLLIKIPKGNYRKIAVVSQKNKNVATLSLQK
jgi:hypothetical protein